MDRVASETIDPTGTTPAVPQKFWLIIVTLVIAEFTCTLHGNMINVALAHLYGLYGDPVKVGWLLTAYSLTAAGSAAVCSRLGDLFGRKRLLLIMLAISMVGSLVSALAGDLLVIILGRALQGASMAVLPLAFGILRENVAPRRLSLGVGLLGGTYAVGVGVGLLIAGVIVDTGHWQGIFLVSAAAAAVSIALVSVLLPATAHRPPDGQPLDLMGGVLFVIPVAALLLGLGNVKTAGWGAPQTWGLMLGGALGMAAWVFHEKRQPNPLIDVRLLRVPQIAWVNVVMFFTSMGPMIYPYLLMPLLQQPTWTGIGMGLTATIAGVIKFPTNITAGLGGLGAGVAATRWGMRRVIITATAVNIAAWLLLIVKHDTALFIVAVTVLAISPCGTIVFSCSPKLIIDAAPEDRTSEATGLTQVLRTIGMAVGSMMYGFTLSTSQVTGPHGARFPDERAYMVSFACASFCCLVALAAALMVPRSADLETRGATAGGGLDA